MKIIFVSVKYFVVCSFEKSYHKRAEILLISTISISWNVWCNLFCTFCFLFDVSLKLFSLPNKSPWISFMYYGNFNFWKGSLCALEAYLESAFQVYSVQLNSFEIKSYTHKLFHLHDLGCVWVVVQKNIVHYIVDLK